MDKVKSNQTLAVDVYLSIYSSLFTLSVKKATNVFLRRTIKFHWSSSWPHITYLIASFFPALSLSPSLSNMYVFMAENKHTKKRLSLRRFSFCDTRSRAKNLSRSQPLFFSLSSQTCAFSPPPVSFVFFSRCLPLLERIDNVGAVCV